MSAAPGPPSRTPGFADPLGQRFVSGDQSTGLVETLWICPEFARAPAFERAVQDGIARLGSFVNPFCGRVRRLDRGDGPDDGLALVSDYVEGNRLSEILVLAEQQQIQINTSATLDILSQLVTVIATLHDHAVGGFHGVLGPERIVIRPDTQIVVVEHVLGPAFRRLPHRSPEEHWRRFRLAVPADPTLPPFGPRTDLVQVGIVAVSLVLGRQLRAGEYPGRVSELLTVATETDLVGRRRPLGEELRSWIAGLLQIDPEQRLKTMGEANDGLDRVLADEDRYIAAPISLEALVRPRHHRAAGARRPTVQAVPAPPLDEPDAVLAQLVARSPTPEQRPTHPATAEPSTATPPSPEVTIAAAAPDGAQLAARVEPSPEPDSSQPSEHMAEEIEEPVARLPGEVAVGEPAAPAAAPEILGAPGASAAGDAAIGTSDQLEVEVGEIPRPAPAAERSAIGTAVQQEVKGREIPTPAPDLESAELEGRVPAAVGSGPGSAEPQTDAVLNAAEQPEVEVTPGAVAMGTPGLGSTEAPTGAEEATAAIASIRAGGPPEQRATDLVEPETVAEPFVAAADVPEPLVAAPPAGGGRVDAAVTSQAEPPAGFTEEIPPSRFTPLFESNGIQTVADRLAAMPRPDEPEPPLISLGRELESSAAASAFPAAGPVAHAGEPDRSTPPLAVPVPSRPWAQLPAQPESAQDTVFVPVETVTLHEFFERTQHGAAGPVAPPRPTPVASAAQAPSAVRTLEPVVTQARSAAQESVAGREPEVARHALAVPATAVSGVAVTAEPLAAAAPADRETRTPPGRRFLVEKEIAPPRRPVPDHALVGPTPPARRWIAPVLAAALLIVASVGLSVTLFRKAAPDEAALATGALNVTSRPPGAEVVVDGEPRGYTPLSLRLAPGRYRLEVRGAGEPRQSTVEVKAGSEVVESFALEEGTTPVGALQVVTRPAGAQVSVDGTARGRTPVTVGDLEPGSHALEITSRFGTVDRNVTVEAGKTVTVNVPIVGYVRIQSPLVLEVLENGTVLGRTDGGPILLAPGLHNLAFVNDAVAFRGSQLVVIEPGQTAAVKVDLPDGIMNLNAIPWAEVWIDGEKVGDTPIANLSMTLGPHEVVFRNPKFGEMRYNVTVSLAAPTRLSVDFAKK